MVLISFGLWLLIIPLYPARCINCGLTRGSAFWENLRSDPRRAITASSVIAVFVVLLIIFRGLSGTPASHGTESTSARSANTVSTEQTDKRANLTPHEQRIADLKQEQEQLYFQGLMQKEEAKQILKDEADPPWPRLSDEHAYAMSKMADLEKRVAGWEAKVLEVNRELAEEQGSAPPSSAASPSEDAASGASSPSLLSAGTEQAVAFVPFVGCESDGQVGPQEAPTGKQTKQSVSGLTAQEAEDLAYYKSQDRGILAPRGWYCFGTYGSGGYTLFVSPEPLDSRRLFSQDFLFQGPGVQMSFSFGGTSGRFAVAGMIARLFPAYKAFATSVMKESRGQPFSFGPYPKDLLSYKGDAIVEYQTPAQTDGLGTDSSFARSDRPIDGVVVLAGSTPDMLKVAVRLPADQAGLGSAIVRQIELVEMSRKK